MPFYFYSIIFLTEILFLCTIFSFLLCRYFTQGKLTKYHFISFLLLLLSPSLHPSVLSSSFAPFLLYFPPTICWSCLTATPPLLELTEKQKLSRVYLLLKQYYSPGIYFKLQGHLEIAALHQGQSSVHCRISTVVI